MDRFHGDEHLEVLTASPREVREVMQAIHDCDSDGHNSSWWAARLIGSDLFRNLDVHDAELILCSVMGRGDSRMVSLQKKILGAVQIELDG